MKDKIKPYFSKYIWYLVWFEGALIISAFISGFPQVFLEAVLGYSALWERIIYGILLTVIPILFYFGPISKMGYKSGEFQISKLIPCLLAMFVTIELLSIPLNAIYVTGGAEFFAQAIRFGDVQLIPTDKEQTEGITKIIMALVNLCVHFPLFLLAGYTGFKNRTREREAMGLKN